MGVRVASVQKQYEPRQWMTGWAEDQDVIAKSGVSEMLGDEQVGQAASLSVNV